MNMKELVEKMSKATGETKKRSEEIIKSFLDIVEGELADGGSVKLVGHFSLEVKERKARKGRTRKQERRSTSQKRKLSSSLSVKLLLKRLILPRMVRRSRKRRQVNMPAFLFLFVINI